MNRSPVVYLVGGPASGKTTLARRVMRLMGVTPGAGEMQRFGLLRFTATEELVVLGDYGQARGTFGGTDALSFAVINDAVAWVAGRAEGSPPVLAEGDRLASQRFFDAAPEIRVVALEVSGDVLAGRRAERTQIQNPSWVAGRDSKAARLRAHPRAVVLPNNDPDDLAAAAAVVVSLLRGA